MADRPLRVLIGCETSGVMRRAFTARGHDVWSCDLLPAEDGSNRHIRSAVRDLLNKDWDLLAVMHSRLHARNRSRSKGPAARDVARRDAGLTALEW